MEKEWRANEGRRMNVKSKRSRCTNILFVSLKYNVIKTLKFLHSAIFFIFLLSHLS